MTKKWKEGSRTYVDVCHKNYLSESTWATLCDIGTLTVHVQSVLLNQEQHNLSRNHNRGHFMAHLTLSHKACVHNIQMNNIVNVDLRINTSTKFLAHHRPSILSTYVYTSVITTV